jgi:cytochrome c peroxidase
MKREAGTSVARGFLSFLLAMALFTSGCGSGKAPDPQQEDELVVGDQNTGERIFVDTRFAEYFAEHMTGVNDPLVVGDPVVGLVATPQGLLPGPFAGQSINCRSCHFVTEFTDVQGVRNRTYADFVDHSPMPRMMNGINSTPRNAMQMVGSLQPHNGPTFLHFDGEFATPEDLVEATLTGRNFGWAPDQYQQAVAHIARVIREDNGQNAPAATYGGGFSYAQIFLAKDPKIPPDFRMPAQYRIDVTQASDEAIFENVAKVVAAYMVGLLFKQDEQGRFIASPYDVFLRINHLPQQPQGGETETQYAQRLLGILDNLTSPIFVDGSYGSFQYHPQPFVFGAQELAGLKIFLRVAPGPVDGAQHAGNCAACHLPPNFTDFRFHNNGSAQEEYDAANGAGAFEGLLIPTLAARNQNFDQYLPASPNHPNASERFRHRPLAGSPQYADLGLWNVYQNPDMPNPQANLSSIVCATIQNCAVDQGLATTIAQFKTPTLRDLEDSAPYFHNGSKAKFDDVVRFYIDTAQLAHQGQLRNAAIEFAGMSISAEDLGALVAFLKALTEDYDDA